MSVLGDPALAGNWTLEPERSSVRFVSRTLWGLVSVHGQFTDVAGEARIGADGAVTGRLVVRADSVRTGIGMRDRHLRAKDFFDAAHHPDIVVEVTGGANREIAARLSIRGITLPITLRASADRQGEDSVHVTAHTEIDRTRWGVGPNPLRMMPPATALAVEAVFVR